jgi:hypothetical protein
MSNNWTHAICDSCWIKRPAESGTNAKPGERRLRIAHRLVNPATLQCCFCGTCQKTQSQLIHVTADSHLCGNCDDLFRQFMLGAAVPAIDPEATE